jgi:MoaA/NifB/PqqE/SkfB family radical SAM enzyme
MSLTEPRTGALTDRISRLRARCDQVALMRPPLKGLPAYLNWLRSNYEVFVRSSRIKARPVKLTFDPTNVCQLRCPLCPTGLQLQDRDTGHAQFHMFQHLIEEVGDHLFFIDFFNWGEPLLNPRVEEFIKLASSKKIVSSMSTNLSLPLTDERIDRIVTSGLNEIIVSLDGASSETYATYRRQGKFDLVCGNMQRIVNAKRRLGQTLPLVTWQFLVFRFNEHEIAKAKAMAKEIGVDRITFRAAFLDTDRFDLPDSERRAIADWAPRNALYQIGGAPPAPAKSKSRCGWHYMSAAINWDGSVAPCCTTFEKGDDFGTIGKDGRNSYMDVLNNAAFRSVRDRFAARSKEPVALVCEHCPTPVIMDYHWALNRQVIMFTCVSLVSAIRRFFGGRRGQGSNGKLAA